MRAEKIHFEMQIWVVQGQAPKNQSGLTLKPSAVAC
jgi:hypothetical protein